MIALTAGIVTLRMPGGNRDVDLLGAEILLIKVVAGSSIPLSSKAVSFVLKDLGK